MIDVVYAVKHNTNNEELRYSIRSVLANVGDAGHIWIAGGRPRWLVEGDGLTYIPTPAGGSAQWNARNNFKVALNHRGVADEVYYFNDDFFVMAPMSTIPVYRGGSFVAKYLSRAMRTGRDSFTLGMFNTWNYLKHLGYNEPNTYDIHKPMPVDRELMLKVMTGTDNVEYVCDRTVYGTLHAPDALVSKNVKIKHPQRMEYPIDPPIISTTDNSFAKGHVGFKIRQAFQEPSPYEKDS